jgi:hypothetical protein
MHLLEEWREERGGRGCVRGGTRYWRGREARARARACAAQLQAVSVGAYIARWQAEASGQAGCWMLLDAAPLAAGWAGVSWGAGVAGGARGFARPNCAIGTGGSALYREEREGGRRVGVGQRVVLRGGKCACFFFRRGEAGLSRGLLEAGFARCCAWGKREGREARGAVARGSGVTAGRGRDSSAVAGVGAHNLLE